MNPGEMPTPAGLTRAQAARNNDQQRQPSTPAPVCQATPAPGGATCVSFTADEWARIMDFAEERYRLSRAAGLTTNIVTGSDLDRERIGAIGEASVCKSLGLPLPDGPHPYRDSGFDVVLPATGVKVEVKTTTCPSGRLFQRPGGRLDHADVVALVVCDMETRSAMVAGWITPVDFAAKAATTDLGGLGRPVRAVSQADLRPWADFQQTYTRPATAGFVSQREAGGGDDGR